MFKLFESSGINIYRYNLPARYGKRRERSADSGFDSVASAAAIAVVLIPESSGIRFGGSFDFMVSCLGSG